jgi:hypothetical protein
MEKHTSLLATAIYRSVTSVAATIIPHAAQAAPLDEDRRVDQSAGKAISGFIQNILRPYHPEKHYMRG